MNESEEDNHKSDKDPIEKEFKKFRLNEEVKTMEEKIQEKEDKELIDLTQFAFKPKGGKESNMRI